MAVFDLLTPVGYAQFLSVNAAALIPAEDSLRATGIAALLPDWADRARSAVIAEDLAGLGADPVAPLDPPTYADTATALGAAYVLEGSRLGARVLSRIAANSPHAAVRDNMAFLRHGEGQGFWPDFLSVVEETLQTSADLARARSGALTTFALFQAALDRCDPVLSQRCAP